MTNGLDAPRAYEPPRIVTVGSIEELTLGDTPTGADFSGSENIP